MSLHPTRITHSWALQVFRNYKVKEKRSNIKVSNDYFPYLCI